MAQAPGPLRLPIGTPRGQCPSYILPPNTSPFPCICLNVLYLAGLPQHIRPRARQAKRMEEEGWKHCRREGYVGVMPALTSPRA